RLLAAGNDRIAVVRNGKLAGVVTRGDVLEALGERAAAIKRPAFSLSDELAGLERLARVFEAVAALSEAYDGVYLVGGTVRDILLGGDKAIHTHLAADDEAVTLLARLRALAQQY